MSDNEQTKVLLLINKVLGKWKMIIIFSILGAVLGVMLAVLKNRNIKYVSKLTFTIEENSSKSSLGGLSSIASSFGVGVGDENANIFSGDNFIELLKSKNLVFRTLMRPIKNKKNKSYMDLFIELNNINKSENWAANSKLKKISYFEISQDSSKRTRDHDSLMLKVYDLINNDNLVIKRENEEINIISVIFESKNESFSKDFSEELMEIASDFYIQKKTEKLKKNFDLIKVQADSVRSNLYGDITSLAVNADNTFALNPVYSVKKVPSAQKQVQVQFNSILLGELLKNQELTRLSLLEQTPLIQVIDKPMFPLKKVSFSLMKFAIVGGLLSSFLIVLFIVLKDNLVSLKVKLNSIKEK